MKRLLAAGTFLMLLVLSSCSKAPPANTSPGGSTPLTANLTIGNLVGNIAPDIRLNDLNGKSVSLSDFRGKVVWLNLWATW